METNHALAKSPSAPGILVAGGTPFTRERLRDWLKQQFPRSPVRVAGETETVEVLAKTEAFAVVLVDIDLPAMQGLELIRRVRPLALGAALIALSSYYEESYRDYAIGAGAVACLSPQVADGTLKKIVGSLLAIPRRSEMLPCLHGAAP